MNKKLIGVLFIFAFISTSVYITALALPSEAADDKDSDTTSAASVNTINEEIGEVTTLIEEEYSISAGFYDDIGIKYTAVTDDGIRLKMLRYHAPGKRCNYGSQPVLLFSGFGANMNEFLHHTTLDLKERYDIDLPDNIASWAIGDENIEKDPMLYYSIAYYLYAQGYDPWFMNYRGTGYGEMKSEMGDKGKTTIDVWALRDVRAAVRKVNSVTGKHPYIGGHSTGGLVCIMYLQGCKFGGDGMVYSSSSLKKERNGITVGPETVKGYIALDPAMIPAIGGILGTLVKSILVWSVVSLNIYIDVREIIETLLEAPLIGSIMDLLIGALAGMVGDWFADLFREFMNIDVSNVNDELLYYLIAYAADSMYFSVLRQFLDFILHKVVREYYKNGWFNKLWIKPPAPAWWDSYYYYTDNMRKVKVPTICFLATHESETMDLVDGDQIIRDLMLKKTYNVNDEWHWIEGAHIDVCTGLRAPADLFPLLGNWLAQVS